MKTGFNPKTLISIPAINIQWPWSRLIIDGRKKIETRGYCIPDHYVNQELAIIETPGPLGRKNNLVAQVIGTVTFAGAFMYKTERHWRHDFKLHLVESNSEQFGFNLTKEKWGWEISAVKRFKLAVEPPEKRGIIFTLNCNIPHHPNITDSAFIYQTSPKY